MLHLSKTHLNIIFLGGKSSDIRYDVTVLTGQGQYGGTDANVYITMYGKVLNTQEIQLDNSNDNFERGQTDSFKVSISNHECRIGWGDM